MPAISNILFIDIETVAQHDSYEAMPDMWRDLWKAKAEGLMRFHQTDSTPEALYQRAGIYAEFGRIICISCGLIQGAGSDKKLIIKSFSSENEQELLQQFCNMLSKWKADDKFLCAHNGKEFDFPYLCRRMVIHGMKLPHCLQTMGKKPWELPFLDTMELWKFGDFRSYTSLNLLAHVLGIASSKDDMDGSMVGEVYWGAKTQAEKDQALHRIITYCQKDVVTMTQVYLRLQGEELIMPANIEIKSAYGTHQLCIGG